MIYKLKKIKNFFFKEESEILKLQNEMDIIDLILNVLK